MLIKDAMSEYLNKVEVEYLRREQARLEAEAAAEAKRQQFIAALRERIELQYGLELTADEVTQWNVTDYGHGRYELYWCLEKGTVRLNRNATTEEISPGGIEKIEWTAWPRGDDYRSPTVTFDHLIPAVVYAQTGKRL
jgi:hypothetical protein